ncbi:hypothetical protein ACJ73_01695 [Blastomyces percursus]|uniref:Uncharacterized protein n=1 Tax=Blastomyces percursus TaxID=1658174 RepID=A0A1J9QDL1_9EURO|nr:hypothetical protein ACJ73_01695 [Blastomyces percursus]
MDEEEVADASVSAIIVTLRNLEKGNRVEFVVRNLPKAIWGVYEGGCLVEEREGGNGGSIDIKSTLDSGEEVDIVLMRKPTESI